MALPIEPYPFHSRFSATYQHNPPTYPISRFEVSVARHQCSAMLLGSVILNEGHDFSGKGIFQQDILRAILPRELIPNYLSIYSIQDLANIGGGEQLMSIAIFLVKNAMIEPTKET